MDQKTKLNKESLSETDSIYTITHSGYCVSELSNCLNVLCKVNFFPDES